MFAGLVVSTPTEAMGVSGLYSLVQSGAIPVYMRGLSPGLGAVDASALGSASIAFLGERLRATGKESPWTVSKGRSSKGWSIARLSGSQLAFVQTATAAASPDSKDGAWCCGEELPTVTVFGPAGAAAKTRDAPAAGNQAAAFAASLSARPVDAAIMILCAWLYFRKATGKVGDDHLAVSLELAAGRQEGWRAITSSVAHGGLLHLGFNLMTLFQLGSLEPSLGSARYAGLSVALMLLTAAAACALQLCAAKVLRRPGSVEQRAVGYSAVLFAWIVVEASQRGEYCPLPVPAGLCLPTWRVPLPGLDASVPLNLAPFLLLLVMQVVVPNVSFAGHLAGIVVG
ncbi:hypothetical protein FNF27_06004 [Cafeteria roenbergensis]|uniref:Peptidase S54 rhomboid domain-containing protein n=1 Tax=Cafeteria roenbergensis TaxID=33653 RepID=A0A5A8E9I5_CAFRO|nr:hypothetical protein FNF29_06456 [Cafeteria roenbergensis]KAA0149473.1 hypothetical protein FNF31_07211 [Cafeteria roenbergensis]KAA0158300.1 hypothetical protein FNF28_06308 [Cafeteria roenbergensis]KAA0172531.1 hypothetical protein FNF27_06004 [Cafeteria roenbergensis]|eukprot:KAA0148831.1 hypothetical protein FNF29_06456 [Cafeteria roenbergensis]